MYSICLEKPSLALKRILLKNKQAFTVFSPSYIIYKEHAVFLGDRTAHEARKPAEQPTAAVSVHSSQYDLVF